MLPPVVLAVAAVGLLLILVLVFRLHAFPALLLVSVAAAALGGIALAEVAAHVQQAMGASLGYIALVIGLGAMVGEMLRTSGGAQAIAEALLARLGEDRAPLALGTAGLVVAVPVFFDVAFILFVPLLYGLTRRSGKPLLGFAVPLLAGLAVAHAFIPPTPGPVAVAGLLGADLGWVILFGLAAGIPALLVGGVWFGRRVAKAIPGRVDAGMSSEPEEVEEASGHRPLGLGPAFGLILLPLLLIVAATVSAVLPEEGGALRGALQFFGHPIVALLVTLLATLALLRQRCGYASTALQKIATKALEPVGAILLVTGAGGVLGKTLVAVGVGEAVSSWMAEARLPLVALAFLLAALVRIAQGSATVAMVTSAGLLAPVVEAAPVSAPALAATTVAVAAGATVLSHVNDSGFWLVSRYLGLTEGETLRSWTVASSLVGGTGFLVVLLFSLFL